MELERPTPNMRPRPIATSDMSLWYAAGSAGAFGSAAAPVNAASRAMRFALWNIFHPTTPIPASPNGRMWRNFEPATNMSRKPTDAMTITEPKSGSRTTGPAISPMINAGKSAPLTNSSTRHAARSSHTETRSTVAIFANSPGWKLNGPRAIHL